MEILSHLISVYSVGGILIGILVLLLAYQSVVIVGGKEIALIERRWLGKKMPQGRVVAMNDEVGIQARTLGPGMHFLIPFIYTAKKSEFVDIMDGKIGLIESVDGSSIPPGKIFAKVIQGHNSFQDGDAFLRNGGQKGPQIDILPPGKYRINPYLFKISIANAAVVDQGKGGVVTSQHGNPIAPGRLLAASLQDHHNFEDGEKFLANGGQKGPQIDILLPGTYGINLNLFKVATEPAAVIESAKVGLITAKDG